MKRAELFRVIVGLLVVVLLTTGGSIVGTLTAAHRLDTSKLPAKFPVTVQIELGFVPSRYHRETVTSYGVYHGRYSSETSIGLARVTREALSSLANYYWIDEIIVVSK